METSMQFKHNASVMAANGNEIGHLSRVVLKQDKKEVTHIVVRLKGLFNKDEKLVPIDQVVEAYEGQIRLNDTAGELDGLPLYEEKQYTPVDEGPGMITTPPIASSPISGIPQPAPPLIVTPGMDRFDPISGSDRFETTTEQNIPTDTVVVKTGANVLSVEGDQVGSLESVITAEPADHPVTHVVVSDGFLSSERKLVPLDWIGRFDPDEVHLSAAAGKLESLDSFTD